MTQDTALDSITRTPRAVALTLRAYGFRETPDGLWTDGTAVPAPYPDALAAVHAVALARQPGDTRIALVVLGVSSVWAVTVVAILVVLLVWGAP